MESVVVLYGFTIWAMVYQYHCRPKKHGDGAVGLLAAAAVMIGLGAAAYLAQTAAMWLLSQN